MELLKKFNISKTMLVGLIAAAVIFAAAIWFLASLLIPGSTQPEDTVASTADTLQPTDDTTLSTTQSSTEPASSPSTEPQQTTVSTEPENDTQRDPQQNTSGGADVDVSQELTQSATNAGKMTIGIDVSRHQGTIDWAQVASAGVDFAMVRIGYRTLVSGEIVADSNAAYNLQQAQANGIKVGAYFFSTAVTAQEAAQEANYVADYIAKYSITYPVAYNCEGFHDPENRQYSLTAAQRTDIALTFLQAIAQRGYEPMFYASKSDLTSDTAWQTSRIASKYKVWVAQYPALPYPETARSDYTGTHAMWQYTASGSVPGIKTNVDVNIAYFGYEQTQSPQNTEPPEVAKPDVEAMMTFTEVNETVTAKIETNMRDIPSQGDESTVMYTLKNGETATRIGISDSGWSKVVFGGNTYYAVSSYLTTDLNYTAETEPPVENTIQTPFTPVNEPVTAKEVVNLRTLPSVTDENSQVVAQLKNGEIATRTGINTDVGWSRVEYNGQVLYCISSYLTAPANTPAE